MNKEIDYTKHKKINIKVTITGSKSESNRLLILKQIFNNLELDHLSNSEDTIILQDVLKSNQKYTDIGHAGTAMRFLTAFFAFQENNEVTLTGSTRMQERPIKPLVDALESLGASIHYKNKKGFPPLLIKGQKSSKNEVEIEGSLSSQYISALMLIGCVFKKGLTIKLKDNITSIPYINLTKSILNDIGINCTWKDNLIHIPYVKSIKTKTVHIESDWSSASYYYSLVALSNKGKVHLSYFKEASLQGDRNVEHIFNKLGVETIFNSNNTITLTQIDLFELPKSIELDLNNTPDIAQTIAVTYFGLNITCKLTGLQTLKDKETDRLNALKIEIEKLGGSIFVDNDSLILNSIKAKKTNELIEIETYQDHRMAMAFAPLALIMPIKINNAEVVAKSYPDFWKDFDKIRK